MIPPDEKSALHTEPISPEAENKNPVHTRLHAQEEEGYGHAQDKKQERDQDQDQRQKQAQNKEIYRLQAEICRTMAEPTRLEIIETLKDGERTVTELVKATGLRQANVSQHLAVLRQAGLVTTRPYATTVYYRIAYPAITEACQITRQILMDQLLKGKRLVEASGS